jgi:phage shock protein PspC (stress-responsive transcriptional regulator)
MSTNDYNILSLYVVFGFLVVLGYIIMAIKYTKSGSTEIWSNKGQNVILKEGWKYRLVKYAYFVMIFLSFVFGAYLVYYLTTTQKEETDEVLIYTGSVLLLVCSTVWAFFPFECNKIILGAVAVGAILILAGISINSENPEEPKKIVALLGASIIVLQTSLFDFGFWTGLIKF